MWGAPIRLSARGLSVEGALISSIVHERFWDEPSRTATERWYVIDAETGAVDRYAMSSCSYDGDELVSVLRSVGFERIVTHQSLTGDGAAATPGLFALAASRRG